MKLYALNNNNLRKTSNELRYSYIEVKKNFDAK